MKCKNNLTEYSLVYRMFYQPIKKLGEDGYFHNAGKAKGILVMRLHQGDVWYHLPEDYLEWKSSCDCRGGFDER
jgi:hypothetical protein